MEKEILSLGEVTTNVHHYGQITRNFPIWNEQNVSKETSQHLDGWKKRFFSKEKLMEHRVHVCDDFFFY